MSGPGLAIYSGEKILTELYLRNVQYHYQSLDYALCCSQQRDMSLSAASAACCAILVIFVEKFTGTGE